MKTILLLLTGILLTLFSPVDNPTETTAAAVISEQTLLADGTDRVQEEVHASSAAVPTLGMPITCGVQLLYAKVRHQVSRHVVRHHAFLLWVRNALRNLSDYLTTLINHITLTFTTIKVPCWQYASDCYVFAYHHILI